MHFTHKKIALFGLLASTVLVGPVAAGGGGGGGGGGGNNNPSTDLFDPPRIYITPDASALTYTDPSPNGIPYRWWVSPGKKQVNFGYYVGSKSWWEPANYQLNPNQPGWTHNSNWIALTLSKKSWVTIEVGPTVPVPCAPPSQPAACDNTGRTGSDLYPAISLYKGQDTTSPQDHTFNPKGPFWATQLTYMDSSKKSDPVTHVLTFTTKKKLDAGQYTVNIGGALALIDPNCASADPTQVPPACLGGRSYQATISVDTEH
jgi:hypothetical protein